MALTVSAVAAAEIFFPYSGKVKLGLVTLLKLSRNRKSKASKFPSEQMLRAAPKGITEIIKSTSYRNGFFSTSLPKPLSSVG